MEEEEMRSTYFRNRKKKKRNTRNTCQTSAYVSLARTGGLVIVKKIGILPVRRIKND